MTEDFCGWAVAAVAVLEDEDRFQYRLRCFTVGTFHEADAIAYAIGEMRKDYLDWEITTATQKLLSLRVVEDTTP